MSSGAASFEILELMITGCPVLYILYTFYMIMIIMCKVYNIYRALDIPIYTHLVIARHVRALYFLLEVSRCVCSIAEIIHVSSSTPRPHYFIKC